MIGSKVAAFLERIITSIGKVHNSNQIITNRFLRECDDMTLVSDYAILVKNG